MHGAVTEARHVFIAASELQARLNRNKATRILEVGFGSGLNFLLAADLAIEQTAELTYCGLESRLMSAPTFATLSHATWLKHPGIAHALERQLKDPDARTTRLRYRSVALDIVLGDANKKPWGAAQFDIVFHDAFSPVTSPTLWTDTFLLSLMAALSPTGVLVTYCAKGAVRRAFTQAGFTVERLPGPPGKREMLRVQANSAL